jgi:hypothetical protein
LAVLERAQKGGFMKSSRGICWVIVLGVLALPAFASNVSLQFTGLPTANNYWGVASYPYDISVNGGPAQWMMCTGYNEHIEGWETWQARVASVGSLDLATHLLDYEAAYLFTIAVADGGADGNINAAVWYLFEGQPGLTTEAAAFVALAQGRTYTQGEFANVLLYSAIPGTENSNLGVAQSFLSSTPEPGALLMFGSGIISVAGVLRKRFKQ